MTARLKAGGHDHVHARLLQGDRFVHGGSCSNQCDSPAAELIQNLFGGNAINKAEYGNPFIQKNLRLIFELNRFVRAIRTLSSSNTIDVFRHWRDATMECLFGRSKSSF